MESDNRPAIVRRSCDQCRARKIGCDRASPCSNCLSARVDCTHSTIAPRQSTPKQRILLSSQYEKKLDVIARDVESIKSLLQGRSAINPRITSTPPGPSSARELPTPQIGDDHVFPVSQALELSEWDSSAHVIDFVKAVIDGSSTDDASPDSKHVLSSLRTLVDAIDGQNVTKAFPTSIVSSRKDQSTRTMPSLEAVVEILRWVREHERYARIGWVCRILPLNRYEELCRKVYFAIDEYTDIELIIANGFLSYVFAEHAAIYGMEPSRLHCRTCRTNLGVLLSRLPLVLSPSFETVAALALGCMHSIEDSKAMAAWTFISAALNMCQSLGYHRLSQAKPTPEQQQLFWTVYSLEGGLSLRFSRSSGIQDTDITLSTGDKQPRSVRIARIQKMVYAHLYSPAGLTNINERNVTAHKLSEELKELRCEAHSEILETATHLGDSETDPMKIVYLHCDLVCQTSLLVRILRAMPTAQGSEISDECLRTARETLELHQECMKLVQHCKDPLILSKYITWAVVHTPFVPYTIIFTRAVQLDDRDDLARLDAFTASLHPKHGEDESSSHPHKLYELLTQAARLYMDTNSKKAATSLTPRINTVFPSSGSDQAGSALMPQTGIGNDDGSMMEFIDWHYNSQQLMELLDGDVIL